MKASIAAMAAAPILALAQTTHDVDVGNGGYVFSPDSIMAADGDLINFHFYNPGQHSVALSTFDAPCVPDMSNQIFSGYVTMPSTGESDMVFQLTVNGTDPLFLYCTQGSHCQSGMAMVVNQGSDTLDAYKKAAVDTTSQDLSTSPVGGLFIMADAGSSSSSSSSAAASSSSSSAASSGSSSMAMGGGAMPTGTTSSSEGMMPTSASAAPMETTSGAAVQVKGAAGAAALGLLGALFV